MARGTIKFLRQQVHFTTTIAGCRCSTATWLGWLLAREESAALAKGLIAEGCERQHIQPGQLIIHADRGPP